MGISFPNVARSFDDALAWAAGQFIGRGLPQKIGCHSVYLTNTSPFDLDQTALETNGTQHEDNRKERYHFAPLPASGDDRASSAGHL